MYLLLNAQCMFQCLELQITFFMVDGSVFWLRRLARKIVVCIISLNLHGGEEGVEGPKRYID